MIKKLRPIVKNRRIILDFQPNKEKHGSRKIVLPSYWVEVRDLNNPKVVRTNYSSNGVHASFKANFCIDGHYLLKEDIAEIKEVTPNYWHTEFTGRGYFGVAHSQDEAEYVLYCLAKRKAVDFSLEYRCDIIEVVPDSAKGRRYSGENKNDK